jgi:hypothetical protein
MALSCFPDEKTMRVVLNSFPFVLLLLVHLKMMMTVMEGWPTETIFFLFNHEGYS